MILRCFMFGIVTGVVLLAAGCASTSTPSSSDALWTPPSGFHKSDPVMSKVRSNAATLARAMTLPELADLALRNNPASRIAWLDARAAAEQVVNAQGYFMPTVTASLGANRQYMTAEPKQVGQMPIGSDYLKCSPGLQVSYLVLNFGGGRQAAVEQALQTVYAADFAFNRTIQTILIDVETAYYGLISANAAMDAAETSVKDAEKTLEAARERSKSGMGTQLEVLQAQSACDQSRYQLTSAKGLHMIARGNLARALNLPVDTFVKIVAPTDDVPAILKEQDLRQLIDGALRQRPDIAALRAQADARRAAVKVADAAQWPNLYLSGGISQNTYENFGGNPLQDRDWAATAGVSLQWNLFNGFQTRSQKRIAVSQAEAALEQLKQAELAASADVWTRFFTYQTAIEKYSASQAYLKSSSASYDLAFDSYKAGLKSILDLLSAETQLAQARSQQIATRQEVFTALANLAYSTGLLNKAGQDLELPNSKP